MPKQKDQSVETLRGLAIILVVIGHVIGDDNTGGMQVSDDSFWRHLYFTFEYLRMPLFTMISGWVYALRPASFSSFGDFTLKKVRRILFPLFVVGTLYFFVQYFMPGTNSKGNPGDIWRIYVFPYTLYWYLPALFWVFLLVAFLDSVQWMQKLHHWAVVAAVAFTLLLLRNTLISETSPNFAAYKMAIYLLPFFLVGLGVKRFPSLFADRRLLWTLGLVVVGLLVTQQLVWYHVISLKMSKAGGIGLLIGVMGSVVLLGLKWRVKWLIWMGGYAYTIYLFHAFGTAGGRIIPKFLGISSPAVLFVASLLTGLLLPVAIEWLTDRFSLTRMFLLGRPWKRSGRD